MAICSTNVLLAQERIVTGQVTASEDGTTLPGVNVRVQGTTVGAVTDIDGNYRIALPANANVLVFSSIGYTSEEVQIGSRTVIDVALRPDVKQLSEVVVTALGITRDERSLGYATQKVEGENLTFTKEQNVIGSLSGKVAGVQVVGSSGASMGGTQKIKIRGVNSLSGDDQPLIVIDGTPISNDNFAERDGVDFGNLGQDINPEDIESINVLKGPTASALYGMRGQFGVIMITTKKGRGAKKVTVDFNSAFSIERVGNIMPYQNMYGGGSSQTWRTLPNGDKYVDMQVDESWGPRMDGTLVRDIFSFYPQDPTFGQLTPFVPQPDNIKDYYETGTNLNNGISISGSNDNTHFRLSFNDTRIEGVEPNTWLNRNNLGLSAGIDISKKLNLSTNINYARNNAQRPGQGSEDGSRYLGQWFQRNLDMNRLRDYQYDDGTFLHWNHRRSNAAEGELTSFLPLYWNNPYFDAFENTTNDSRDRFFGDVGLTYQILPDLKVSGFIRSDMYTQNIEGRTAFGGKDQPAYWVGKYQNREMNYELLAQYSKAWNEFSINVNLGGNIFDRNYSYLRQETVGGLSAPGFYNIDASIDRPLTTSHLLRKQIRSGYGMVSLGYKNIYFIDASLRNDNTSTLPSGNNSYWYPSISGSMVFSDVLDWTPLSLGKLRVSYAQAGSDFDAYKTTNVYGIGTPYAGPVSANPLTVPNIYNNPAIEPSFAHSYEAGVDLRFLQNRVGLEFTYYEQININQILLLDVSGTSGFEQAYINAGQIENKGIEISLSATPIQSSNFTWNTVFNLNRNRNMIVELHPDLDVYTYGSTRYSSVYSYANSYVGKPFASLVGQAYQRDPATGQILLGSNNMPLFTDATHNFGTALPDYTGGFQNTFRIFGFDLSAMIDYQKGGQFFSRSKMLAVRTGLDPITVATNDRGMNVRDPLDQGGGVKVEGISAESGEPVSTYVDPQAYYGVVGRRIYEDWVYDASFIRLREVRLGYTFSKSNLGGLPFERVGLAIIARNPAMIWQKAPKGLDPSELSAGSQGISWYESGQLNTVRSYGLNLNITF
ncbi:hypothetical protein D770_19770 [Flammeovirgaceae bacterium 311]|nr:hypothetical protein D770_19770 [Flammeovirgaceae bacterium 311]